MPPDGPTPIVPESCDADAPDLTPFELAIVEAHERRRLGLPPVWCLD